MRRLTNSSIERTFLSGTSGSTASTADFATGRIWYGSTLVLTASSTEETECCVIGR